MPDPCSRRVLRDLCEVDAPTEAGSSLLRRASLSGGGPSGPGTAGASPLPLAPPCLEQLAWWGARGERLLRVASLVRSRNPLSGRKMVMQYMHVFDAFLR